MERRIRSDYILRSDSKFANGVVPSATLTTLPSDLFEEIGEWFNISSLLRFEVSTKKSNVTLKIIVKVILWQYPHLRQIAAPQTVSTSNCMELALKLFPIIQQALNVCPDAGVFRHLKKQLAITQFYRKQGDIFEVSAKLYKQYRPEISDKNYCLIWHIAAVAPCNNITLATGVANLSHEPLSALFQIPSVVNENDLFITLQVMDKRNSTIAEICHAPLDSRCAYLALGLHAAFRRGSKDDRYEFSVMLLMDHFQSEFDEDDEERVLTVDFHWLSERQTEVKAPTIFDVLTYIERCLVFR